MAYDESTIFDKIDDGDSPIYVGIKYLAIIANQINVSRESARLAYNRKGGYIMVWLNELRVLYDIVENRTNLPHSKRKIKFFEYKIHEGKLNKNEIEIDEKQKYEKWFNEIERMFERTYPKSAYNISSGRNGKVEYENSKKILSELSKCQRELLRDANTKHLIMPEGMKNAKEMVKKEWEDREKKKDLYGTENEMSLKEKIMEEGI